MTTDPNATQRDYWNSRRAWIDHQDAMDRQLDGFGRAAMATLGDLEGRAVLDIGCGCGHTSLQLGEAVGRSGKVRGLDISAPMVAVAEGRARAAGLDQVTFEVGEAQLDDPGSGYDAVFSRFGVMFFADPVAAFANLRHAARPGAPLGFVCWRDVSRNPWMTTPNRAAMTVVEFPPRGPGAADPFAFGDPDLVRGILEDAGWSEVELTDLTVELALAGGDPLDEVVELTIELGPARAALEGQSASKYDEVRAAVRAALEPHERDGAIRLSGSTWVVTARA
jgi:SAM-dependent methyltransferase